MHRLFSTLRLAVFALAIGWIASVARAQLLADLVNDYATTGLPLTATGTGTWTFYASTTMDPTAGTLTPLTFGSIGNAGNNGYGLFDGGFNVAGVSTGQIFTDGADPAGSFLAWHPGNSSPRYLVLSWTAGAGESGPIQIAGTFSRQGEPASGFVSFHVYVDNVESYSALNVSTGGPFNFDFTSSIITGQSVSFVLDDVSGYFGDESLISASITAVPEPSTYALIFGAGALGLTAWHRRRRGKVRVV